MEMNDLKNVQTVSGICKLAIEEENGFVLLVLIHLMHTWRGVPCMTLLVAYITEAPSCSQQSSGAAVDPAGRHSHTL